MARSTSLIVLLAALVIQVVLACSGIEKGRYLIEFEGKFLTPGPVPLVWPPPDLHARLWNLYLANPWLIEPTEGGYTIKQSHNEYAYRLGVNGVREPYYTATKGAATWAVTSAGDGYYTIGVANENLLLTAPYGDEPATLRPADGSAAQKWILSSPEYRNLYPNRFQHIL